MDRPQLMRSILNWLRAGYPNGVPTNDYVPLMALLRRQLTDEEVHEISDALIADAADHGETEPISRVDVGVLITKVTEELPSEPDIARVRAILEDAGWTFEAGQRDGTSEAS